MKPFELPAMALVRNTHIFAVMENWPWDEDDYYRYQYKLDQQRGKVKWEQEYRRRTADPYWKNESNYDWFCSIQPCATDVFDAKQKDHLGEEPRANARRGEVPIQCLYIYLYRFSDN